MFSLILFQCSYIPMSILWFFSLEINLCMHSYHWVFGFWEFASAGPLLEPLHCIWGVALKKWTSFGLLSSWSPHCLNTVNVFGNMVGINLH